MYLKRIVLQGFKSFAEKTVIEVHQGVTAIVGPNGSGKSNISDAIRWVMGEQSAKTLRGGKMEDVIFAGTQKRKPLGYAEVSLVLDNSTHFLECDYNEVEVTRRVFRSGDSEYLINRNPCRLKDINEMFMDTGLGRDGYSIVGQGKIAEIVSSKGDERRQIFEEAAGISKYRYRKNEAERKLAHTEDNLTRVRDILSELTDRVEPLRRQSEKAIKFLDLREELKGIEISALLEIIDAKRADAKKTGQIYADAAAEFESAKQALDESNKKSDELYAAIKETDGEIEEKRQRLSKLEGEGAAVENERALLENNIENHKTNIVRIEGELAGWSKREDELRETKKKIEQEKVGFSIKCNDMESELAALEGEDRALSGELAAKNKSLEEARENAISLRQKKAEAQSRIESIELVTRNIETRRFSVEVDIASAADDIRTLTAELSALDGKCTDAQIKTQKAGDDVFNIRRDQQADSQKISELKNKYNEISSAYGEKQGRRKMLVEMERGLEGYARGVRELLKAESEGKYRGKLVGVLSKLVSTDKKYITAVETALGNAMQNIVVDTEEDAKQAIEYLKEKRLGRVTFLPITSQEGRRLDNEERIMKNRGAVAVACDVVSADDKIRNVVDALLGRTVIMDNMDNAIALARATHYKFKIVTLGGELLQPGGSVTGGSTNRAQALLGRKDEIELLAKQCDELNRESEKIDAEIDSLTDRLSGLRDAENKLRAELSRCENDEHKLKAEHEMKESLLKMAKERLDKFSKEKEQISGQQTDTDESKRKLREVIEGSDELIERAEELISERQNAVRTVVVKREELSVKIIDKKMQINNARKDTELAQQRIESVMQSILNSKSDFDERKSQIANEENAIAALNAQVEQNNMRAAQCAAAVQSVRDEIQAYLSGRSGSDSELETLREQIKEMNDKILILQSEVVRIESKKNKIDEDLENAASRLWDDYELTYNSAMELKKDIGSLPAAQKRISELKSAIKSLGNINVDAIEEYKDVKERYEFLSSQVSDMEKAKADLQKLIGEMMNIMREQFAEKFVIINRNFGKSFVDLFGGGKAEVRLVDPIDTLESPIEIEVQPPGKKLQNLTLLSGGEHALTAIALLFALLQVSPAPFLVLDEIEAALDDENVYRFGDYIRNYGNSTQFVVITHRRGTMEAADVLYGVTMQERGVSRLLSMKLEDVALEE